MSNSPHFHHHMLHIFQVQGITCGHCEKAITEAVLALDPQASIVIDRSRGQVHIRSQSPAVALAQCITQEGYVVLP